MRHRQRTGPELGTFLERLGEVVPEGPAVLSSHMMRDPTFATSASAQCGALITFSGLDGSGKSSQCARAANRLLALGYEACVVKYAVSRRSALETAIEATLAAAQDETPACVEQRVARMIAADAAVFVLSEASARLQRGIHVVTDRYVWDLLITLRAAFGVGDIGLADMWRFLPVPDLAFLIDVDADTAGRRIKSRTPSGRRPAEQSSVLCLKEAAYRRAMTVLPWVRIDGTRSEDVVGDHVWLHIERLLTEEQAP